jgi:hypothetical protein
LWEVDSFLLVDSDQTCKHGWTKALREDHPLSRREIVLLVSRAVAVLVAIPALFTLLLSIPQQVWILSQTIRMEGSLLNQQTHSLNFEGVGIAISVVRIVVESLIAMLFWRCSPAIERLLLPVDSN